MDGPVCSPPGLFDRFFGLVYQTAKRLGWIEFQSALGADSNTIQQPVVNWRSAGRVTCTDQHSKGMDNHRTRCRHKQALARTSVYRQRRTEHPTRNIRAASFCVRCVHVVNSPTCNPVYGRATNLTGSGWSRVSLLASKPLASTSTKIGLVSAAGCCVPHCGP